MAPLLFQHEFTHHTDDVAAFVGVTDSRMRFRLTPRGQVYAIAASRRFGDAQASSLLAFPKLIDFVSGYPFIKAPPFTDAGVHHIMLHPRLQSIFLSDNPSVTDETLRAIGKCGRIKWLGVPHCSITDAGVRSLAGCTQLLKL